MSHLLGRLEFRPASEIHGDQSGDIRNGKPRPADKLIIDKTSIEPCEEPADRNCICNRGVVVEH